MSVILLGCVLSQSCAKSPNLKYSHPQNVCSDIQEYLTFDERISDLKDFDLEIEMRIQHCAIWQLRTYYNHPAFKDKKSYTGPFVEKS